MKDQTMVIITEPAAVAALKDIFYDNGPGRLRWNFSSDGTVVAKGDRLWPHNGFLVGLNR